MRVMIATLLTFGFLSGPALASSVLEEEPYKAFVKDLMQYPVETEEYGAAFSRIFEKILATSPFPNDAVAEMIDSKEPRLQFCAIQLISSRKRDGHELVNPQKLIDRIWFLYHQGECIELRKLCLFAYSRFEFDIAKNEAVKILEHADPRQEALWGNALSVLHFAPQAEQEEFYCKLYDSKKYSSREMNKEMHHYKAVISVEDELLSRLDDLNSRRLIPIMIERFKGSIERDDFNNRMRAVVEWLDDHIGSDFRRYGINDVIQTKETREDALMYLRWWLRDNKADILDPEKPLPKIKIGELRTGPDVHGKREDP